MPERNEQDIFQRELTRGEIEQLIAAGFIGENQREAILSEHRKSIDWKSWLSLWTSTVGAVFLLAGVVFFFAWNWKELSPFARFSVLETGVVAATIGALLAGIRRQAGQWLLVAASVFTGVLVAVYGQVYQTGADAFEVFALWAALIVGWVMISRFAPLWLFWLVIVQTAVVTWFAQVQVASGLVTWTEMFGVLGVISVGFAAVWEWLHPSDRFSWLRGDWIRVALVTSALIWLSAIPWEAIFDFRWRNYEAPMSRGIGLLAWLLAVVGGGFFYTYIRPSLTAVGLCVLAGAGILVIWFGKEIIEVANEGAISWLLAAIIAIGVFSGAAIIISKAARIMGSGKSSAGESKEAS